MISQFFPSIAKTRTEQRIPMGLNQACFSYAEFRTYTHATASV